MRTQSPVFVVTGKEEAVLHVMEEIQNAAEHFTHIRASRNQHKSLGGSGIGGTGGSEVNKPSSREGDVMIQVTVPYRVVGLVVGLKGQTIKAIQQDTDTFIVTPNRDKAPIFEIRGQPENVERAKSMILRHIETRTRHCRLQDSTNLPANWSIDGGMDETMRGGSSGSVGGMGDFSMFQHRHSDSSNGDSVGSSSLGGQNHGSVSLANTNLSNNQTFTSNNGNVVGSHQFSPSYAASTSPPANGNYGSWSGYSSLFDHHLHHNHHPHQQLNGGRSMTAWSSATSDFAPIIGCSGANDTASFCGGSSHNTGLHLSLRSSQHKNFTSMNMGSMSSSNSSASVSPPHDFISEGPYPSCHHGMSMVPFSSPMGVSPPLRGLLHENAGEPADFSNFPLLSAGSSSPGSTKGSLVLGNLFRSSNSGASSSVGMHMLSGSSSSSNSSNNSTASPTSTDGFLRGEDHIGSLTAPSFAAGGPATAASAPANLLGASSSSTSSSSSASYPLAADTVLYAGASGSGNQMVHLDSPGGVEGTNGSCNHFHKEDSSQASKTPLSSVDELCSHSSPTPRLCRVCEEAEIVVALVPCGHNLFCMECAERIVNRPSEDDRKCPVCRENAADVLRIRA